MKLTSGGTEIVAIVRAPASDDSETLLLEKLPRTPRVVNLSTNCLLHVFFGGPKDFLFSGTPE